MAYSSISENDLVDLHGKVAIVTGGNTGIGYGTVQFLLRKGAKVYIAARNEQRAQEAITQLTTEGIADGVVEWLSLDLSDPRIAKRSAEAFLAKEERLDILVNNAAIGAVGPYKVNQDGLRDVMVTNHISHFAFTDVLLPLMKRTSKEANSDIRIVNVTSMAHSRVEVESFVGKESLNKDYGESFNGYLDTYGYSKLANILHIRALQKRLDAEGTPITCIAVHPGPVLTDGSKGFLSSVPYVGRAVSTLLGPLLFSSWRTGAFTSAFAAASTEVCSNRDRYKGSYLSPVARLTRPSSSAQNSYLAEQLYNTTESVLKEMGL